MAKQARPFPIVGIGASAGGVDALEGLFRGIPEDPGCAFVIVTHLNPERRSLLPQIVARYTALPVHVAQDGVQVGPNEVHVLPSDAVLDIRNGRLQIHKASSHSRDRKPIDAFFSALARDQGEKAVGIVLSGSDGDGTLGVKAIKEWGGLSLAQVANGHPPQYPAMPDSAIATGMVDLALPVVEMGPRLVDYARSLGEPDSATTKQVDGHPPDEVRAKIYAILRSQVGHDFSGYKDRTFLRRVRRRMQVNQLEDLDLYVERLGADPKEVAALFRDLLINVTNFFRDPDAFQVLETEVIPKLFEKKGDDDFVRVWVPGCATGEEAYSIAMLLREHMDASGVERRVQVFATDIDEPALGIARAGRYPEALLEGISAERRQRFFVDDDGSYLVTKSVRELCVFSPHSLIRDPPFSRLDLISCRNLLIYFGPDAQNQVIPTFHYALRPGGYLFLGTSENVTQFSDIFTPVDKKHRVFRSRGDAGPPARLPLALGGLRPNFGKGRQTSGGSPFGLALRQDVEAHVIDRYAPAHVVVNRDGDVVHYSPRTGKYLEATSGAPSRQLLNMARKGLRLDLRVILQESIQTGRRTSREGVVVEVDHDRIQRLNLLVEPIGESGDERLFLVVFSDVGPVATRDDAVHQQVNDESTLHLERELRDTRERLQSLIEEYETSLEELRASNEELVSVNEELQSTNEELEASKEELQSVNEELHTVNSELHGKVEQLDRANSDLTNIFESTRVATVFLDQNLVIRSFTPAISRIFSILPTDRGRPLTDLASRISLPAMEDDLRSVLSTGTTIERTIAHDEGRTHYLQRLVPYLDGDRKITGVVMTLVDVTTLTAAEAQQKVLIDELNHRVKNMLMVVISVAEQTYRTAEDPVVFKTRLIDRIHAMARSYELLSREHWMEADIQDLILPHIEPFGAERMRISGGELRLKPKQALSLGMIIHELVTNAGKYGALSVVTGHIDIAWRRDGDQIHFTWREQDGPKIAGPSPPLGFGLSLLQRETRGLGGKAVVEFGADGLTAILELPA